MSTLLLVPHALPHQECASPDERLLKDEGTQRRPHGLPLVPLRPQRVKRLLEPLCTPPNRSAAERQCACRPQRKPVLHRWRREGACLQEDSVRRSTAPCAHNQPRSPRSHEVRVRSAQSCLTQLARLNLAAGRQSARRRSHALISGHRRPPPASRSAYGHARRPRRPGTNMVFGVPERDRSFGDRRQLARRLEPHRLACAWIAPPGALTVRVVSPSSSGQAECLYPLRPSGRTHIAPGWSGVGSETCVAGGLVAWVQHYDLL